MINTLSSDDKSLIASVITNHSKEMVTIKQGKSIIVLSFDQIKELYAGVNFYNQIEQTL